MSKYIIREDLIDQYVNRETMKKMKIVVPIFLAVLVGIFCATYSSGLYTRILPGLGGMFLLLAGIIYIGSISQVKKFATATTFEIDEQLVAKKLDHEKLSFLNKAAMARNEAKYGATHDQTILVKNIELTLVTENEISVRAFSYDFFNGNGKIDIPKELDGYDTIKAMMLNNAELYKVKPINS